MPDVVLVASLFGSVKISENLGISFLAAVTRERGFSVEVLDPSVEGWTVAETADEVLRRPSAVLGVSVLRDEQKADVLELAERLRAAGDDRFVVVGGHAPTIAITTGEEDYPPPMEGAPLALAGAAVAAGSASSRPWGPADDWSYLPWGTRRVSYRDLGEVCDAFLLGEADLSFPDLVATVLGGGDWRTLPGVAYVRPTPALALAGGHPDFVVNPPAPKPDDLDDLPFMARDTLEQYVARFPGAVAASLNLGRGCMYRCTFCTVAVFQGIQTGSRHRQRSVDSVVEEMRLLHDRYGITSFNFEDDNFIIRNKPGIAKIHALCEGIRSLPFPVSFSVFCRPDAVSADLFRDLRDAGMTIVYLGLESVHEPDLAFFHKGMKLSQVFQALDTLIDLGYSLEVSDGRRVKIGFIAWHPLTTIASLRDAVAFVRRYRLPPKILRRKLLLYSGIPIKQQIRDLGLLDPDAVNGWRYQDPSLEHLERAVEDYVQLTVSRPYRDRVRTVEKALAKYRNTQAPERLAALQDEMDEMCVRFVEEVLDVGEDAGPAAMAGAVAEFTAARRAEFARYVAEHDLERLIDEGFRLAGLPTDAVDAFRQ